jgi:hypothetical protein
MKKELLIKTSDASDQKTPPYPPAMSFILENELLKMSLKVGELK